MTSLFDCLCSPRIQASSSPPSNTYTYLHFHGTSISQEPHHIPSFILFSITAPVANFIYFKFNYQLDSSVQVLDISHHLPVFILPSLNMHFSYALVLAALGLECAIAQPAHHRYHHNHRRHASPNVDVSGVDFSNPDLYNNPNAPKVDVSGVDFSDPDLYKSKATTVDVAAPTVSVNDNVATPTVSVATPTVSVNVNVATPTASVATPTVSVATPKVDQQNNLFGGRTTPIDKGTVDQYIGNVGIPYGSNMAKVKESDSGSCKYTIKFVNDGGNSLSVIVWNKSGKDGQSQSGMGSTPNLNFPLAVGGSQVVCFDENTQLGFARDCQRNPLKGNLPDCTWGEADFGNLQNGGWSGYDVSSIPNSAGNVENLTLSCPGGKTSSQAKNSFVSASQTNAGGSLAPGSIHITATWQ